MEDYEDYIVYCKTQHSYEIQKMIDMLKEVLDEAKFDFIRDPNQDAEIKKMLEKKKSDAENESEESDNESENESDKKNKKPKKLSKKSKKNEDDSDEESDDEDDEKNKKSSKLKKSDSQEKQTEENADQKQAEKKKNPGGIRIVALDPHRTLLIYVKLSSSEFDEFYVKTKTTCSIGLDLLQLHKFMKTVDKESIMTMKIMKEDKQYIKFELENTVRNQLTQFHQKILDIDDDQTKLPTDTNFEMSVAMDTSDFRKICQEMSQFSEYVEITCTAKEITFRCKGDITDFVKTFKHSDDGSLRIMCMNRENKKGLMMVQAIYNLKHLVTFGKCVNLCTEMQLFLKNDYPLFINYPIGKLGKMLVGLSPVDEKTIKRDADYDDSNDKYYNSKKAVVKEM